MRARPASAFAELRSRAASLSAARKGADSGRVPLAALSAVAGSLVAHLFAALIRLCRRAAERLPGWARPVAASLALADLGSGLPNGLTFGEEQLGDLARTAAPSAVALVLIAAGHLLSAAFALAGRWKGGIIIPMFLVGYCVARATAILAGHGGDYVVGAVCMMAACNVGMTKTPLGSTLVVAQMTGIQMFAPVLLASLVSLVLSSRVSFIGGQRHRDAPTAPAPSSDDWPSLPLPREDERSARQR